jgi:hypothetical protein
MPACLLQQCGRAKRCSAAFVFLGATLFLISVPSLPAGRPQRSVTYSSECSCENDHGVARWRAKTDASTPPTNARDIAPITPSEIFSWQGPGMIPRGGARTGKEVHWFALTGRVISVQAENDGDVHMVLVNANDRQPGKVIAEIPLGAKWCALRTTVFSWTNAIFPFSTGKEQPFRLAGRPVVTVIGKAFYDTDHSGKELRNNRRPHDKDKAVWEIHPVMAMRLEDSGLKEEAPEAPLATIPPPAQPSPQSVSPQQFVTITQPVNIRIPYGETVLQPGTKLPIVSRDATMVRVRYLDGIQSIPVSATDLH